MVPADARVVCTSDSDCDDGLYCNGVERCAPEGASGDGCVEGEGPCADGETCSEETAVCIGDCEANADSDGDGDRSIACGGTDCDDEDARRSGTFTEVCDAAGLDEDCDVDTLGPDDDGDGFVRAGCCNARGDGTVACGDDCDDDDAGIAPGATEVCDGVDNDCAGGLDFPGEDDDGDGWADCVDLPAAARDCDDEDGSRYPTAIELCDRVDNDCDGDASDEDDDHDGHLSPEATCVGDAPRDDCDDAASTIATGAPELCDARDNDCDDTVDEDCGGTGCDAGTEAGFASTEWIDATRRTCATECGAAGAACVEACVVRIAAVSAPCQSCVREYLACSAPALAVCGAPIDDACVRGVCSACERRLDECAGFPPTDCTACESDRDHVTIGIGALGLCQEGSCATDTCILECVEARADVSGTCASSCFGDLLGCQRAMCSGGSAPCDVNPTGYVCRRCIDTMCVPALEVCSGADVTPPACLMGEAQGLRAAAMPLRMCIEGCYEAWDDLDGDLVRDPGEPFDDRNTNGSHDFASAACVTACVSAATMPVVIGDACASCYAQTACVMDECLASSCTNGDSVECDACRCRECEEETVACAGFGLGTCPAM
jgi:hypothetical protein